MITETSQLQFKTIVCKVVVFKILKRKILGLVRFFFHAHKNLSHLFKYIYISDKIPSQELVMRLCLYVSTTKSHHGTLRLK